MYLKNGLKKKIRKLFKGAVIQNKEEAFCYAYDCSLEKHSPDLVVFPQKAQQIAELMKLAQEEKFAVVPRGAGTGLSGGSVPLKGGVVVCLEKMDHFVKIDRNNFYAEVEAGVITGRLQKEVWNQGLFYPPDPGSVEVCTMGGNVAENAGGPRGLKYGVTRDYLLGLEIVTPQGEILITGGKTLKNVTGYDLTHLFAGSEGTLGIVTKIIVKLIARPQIFRTVMLTYNDLEKATFTVSGLLKEGIMPTTMEFMDKVTINCVEDYLKIGLPRDAAALLLVEVDGKPREVESEIDALVELACKWGATSIRKANSEQENERLWRARKAVAASLSRVKPTKISEDATVPRTRVPEMVKKLKEIANRYGLKVAIFGHAGDGNLHPNFLVDARNPEEMIRVHKAVEELFEAALKLGGTLSGEHGVGYTKAPFLEQELGKQGVKYLLAIKEAVDPAHILNPGKIFLMKESR